MFHATLTKGIGAQAARVALATILVMAWLSTTSGSVYSAGDETTRVSVDSAGNQGNSFSATSSMSADGRFVAFESDASDLAPNDAPMCGTEPNKYNCIDIFVRDRHLGTTTRVSVDSAGNGGNGTSPPPSLTAESRFGPSESRASDLVPNDSSDQPDVFAHDRQTNDTTIVSVNSAGNKGDSYSYGPSISADGRFVAFWSAATNLVPNDTNSWKVDVFVRDRQLGTTTVVSVDSAGNQGNNGGGDPSISADGRFVAFVSSSTNLVPNDSNNTSDVFVRDRQLGTTALVSVDSAGTQGNKSSGGSGLSISADGRFVAFDSAASNLAPNDTNNTFDVFVRDLTLGTTTRVSVDSAGNQGNGSSQGPSISADGRLVAFHSDATNLVPNDTNSTLDVFVRGPGQAVLPSPSTPDLAPGSDTGVSSSDNLTKDTTPTFTGTAPPNSTVTLLVDGVAKGTATATAGGSYSVTASALTSGRHSVTATATVAGSTSPASGALNITVDNAAPAVKAPSQQVLANTSLGTSTAPVRIAWSATDSSGIARYELQQSTNGGAWTAVALPTATTTAITPSLAPGASAYRFQIRATDRAGNASAYGQGPAFRVGAYQETSASVAYTGAWTAESSTSYYGGSVRYASAAGALATLSVPAGARQAAWVSTRGASRGRADVYVDGVKVTATPVDLYSAGALTRRVVFARALDPAVAHKVQVRVLGTKDASSTGARVDVDAFVVIR